MQHTDKLLAFIADCQLREGEVIKEIPFDNTDGRYFISNKGDRVISLCSNRAIELKIQTDTDNYSYVYLNNNSQRQKKYIHRLVAEAFLKFADSNLHTHHIDQNRQNNNVSNLIMLTPQKHNKIHRFLSKWQRNTILFDTMNQQK